MRAETTLAETAAALAERFPALFTPGQPRPIKLRIQADIQQRAPGLFTKKQLSIFLHRHTTSTAYIRALVASTQRFDLDGRVAGDVRPEHLEAAKGELERRRQVVLQRRAQARAAKPIAADRAADPAADSAGASGVPAAPGPRPGQASTQEGEDARAGQRPPRSAGRAGRSEDPSRREPRPPRAARPGSPPRHPGASQRPPRTDRPDRPHRPPPYRPLEGPLGAHVRAPAGMSAPPGAHRPHAGAQTEAPLPEDAERRDRAQLLRRFEGSPLTAANFCALKGLALGEFEAQIALARRERAEREAQRQGRLREAGGGGH